MILNHYYYCFESAIDDETCDKIIEAGLKSRKEKGITSDKKSKVLRNSYVSWIQDQWIYDLINPYIHSANNSAGWNFDWDWSEPCQFTEYGLDQFYNWHTDQSAKPYPDNFREECKGKIRKISMTIILSKSSDYEGGNLEFKHNYQLEPSVETLSLARKRGTVIVFPSFIWHRVTPVTKGKRYSLVNWSLGTPYK